MITTNDNNIYLSTGSFTTSSLGEIVEICDKINFHNLELSSGLHWSKNLVDEIENARKKCNLLIHNYFPPPREPFVLNLAAKNPHVLQLSINHCKRAITLCAEFGAPFFSVHSGFAFEVDASRLGRNISDAPRYSINEAKKIFIESLQALTEFGASKKIGVAIENNVVAPMNLIDGKNLLLLGATAEELIEIYESVNSNNFGILIDVGHLKVTANALQFNRTKFLHQVENYITAFHLNDNDGTFDSNQIFDEKAWFISEIRRYPNHKKVIESYKLSIEQLKQIITLVRTL